MAGVKFDPSSPYEVLGSWGIKMQQVVHKSLRILDFPGSLQQFLGVGRALQAKKSVALRVHLGLALGAVRFVGRPELLTVLAGWSRCGGDKIDERYDFTEATIERTLEEKVNIMERERGRRRAAGGR